MNLERLLPEPPEGFRLFDGPEEVGSWKRLWFRYLAGYGGGRYVAWVAESSANPVKVIEIGLATYDTPSLAMRVSRSNKEREAIVKMVGPDASLTQLQDGAKLASWPIGSLRFTSLYRVLRHAVIECTAVSDKTTDPIAMLDRLHSEIGERLPVIPDVPAIPPGVRQTVAEVVILIALWLVLFLALPVAGYNGDARLVLLVVIASWVGWYYWKRWRTRRRTIELGDRTGTIRRALTSLGIDGPRD